MIQTKGISEENFVYIEDIPELTTDELKRMLVRYEDELEWLKLTNRPYLEHGIYYNSDAFDDTEEMVDKLRDELENRGLYI